MSKRIAVLSGDVVVNVIIADSAKAAEELTGLPCVEAEHAENGFVFDKKLKTVLPIKPFESWKLNDEKTGWVAPVAKPGENFTWDEAKGEWVEIIFDPEVIEA